MLESMLTLSTITIAFIMSKNSACRRGKRARRPNSRRANTIVWIKMPWVIPTAQQHLQQKNKELLSYLISLWSYGDSNPGPPACKAGALAS